MLFQQNFKITMKFISLQKNLHQRSYIGRLGVNKETYSKWSIK